MIFASVPLLIRMANVGVTFFGHPDLREPESSRRVKCTSCHSSTSAASCQGSGTGFWPFHALYSPSIV